MLGPIDVYQRDGRAVALGGKKPRSVLAVLLLHANEPVSTDRLAMALWGEDVAGGAASTVHVHMSRLRKALGDPEAVVTTAAGYRLRVRPDELDAERFERLVEEGRIELTAGRPQQTVRLIRRGMAMWRGPPLANLADEPFAAGEIARLEERRVAAIELGVEARLEVGHHVELVAELQRLVDEHPGRERFACQLMLALYRCGRQAESLEIYSRARAALIDSVGLEPGPELRELQAAILRQDESLRPRPVVPGQLLLGRGAGRHGAKPAGPDGSASVRCPFKGLAPFDADDAAYFHGRDSLIARLATRLAGPSLLGVVGPSGSGKSSVLRAGLLPALRDGILPGGERWAQFVMRPGRHPLAELTGLLDADVDERNPVIIVVDQFEETFTVCDDEVERRAFVDALISATRSRAARWVVVIALRADAYGRCAVYRELADMLAANHLLVGPMTGDELRRAIEVPAERAGLRVDADLTDVLVHDVEGEPAMLPLLSTALLELWQHREGRRLTRMAYERSGGVRHAVAGLAEEAFGQLSERQQNAGRGVLMRMVTEGPDGGVERRRVALEEFETMRNADVGRVVALLADRRLLTVGAGTIELAHESLLSQWPRLNGWIDADREGLRIQRRLTDTARGWDDLARDPAALYRGAPLAAAAAWAGDHAEQLSRLEREFLAAGTANERSELDRERRRALRLRTLAASLAALSVVVTALAAVAWHQAVMAQRERSVATRRVAETTSLTLAAASSRLLASRPDAALLLALEANRTGSGAEARSSAVAALITARAPGVLALLGGSGGAVASSGDGRTFAASGGDRTIRVWDVRTDEPLGAPLIARARHVTCLALSGDGRTLAAAADDRTITLWNVRTGRQLGRPLISPVLTERIVIDHDGRTLITVGLAKTIQLWDLRSRNALGKPLKGHGRFVAEVGFQGRRALAAIAANNSVQLWDVRARAPVGGPMRQHAVTSMAFSPDATRLASSDGGRIRLWNLRTRGLDSERILGPTQSTFGPMAFDAAGRTLAAMSYDRTIRAWAIPNLKPLRKPITNQVEPFRALTFIGRGRALASVGHGGVLRLWDMLAARPLTRTLVGHARLVWALAFAPGERMLASASADRTIRLWDLRSPTSSSVRLHAAAWYVAFSDDGRRLTSVDTTGAVQVWDPRRGVLLKTRGADRGAVYLRTALSSDGGTVAFGRNDGTILLWDVARQAALGAPIPGHGSIQGLALDRDARTLAVSTGREIRLWDVRTRRQVGAPLTDHPHSLLGLGLSADGGELAVNEEDGSVRLWEVARRKPIGTLRTGHTGFLPEQSFSFSPDMRTLVLTIGDRVQLWDVRTDQRLGSPPRGRASEIPAFALSPDGRTIVDGGADNTIRVWRHVLWRNLSELRREVCAIVGSSLTETEWHQFAASIPYHRSCP